ncbi:MAG: OmpA family protein [Flavobacteriaceae bacterium]
MKIISRCLFIAAAMFISNTAFAQDENNPWVVTVATNAVDTYPTNQQRPNIGNTGKLFENFFETQNWNTLPAITTVGISRHITEGFSLSGRYSFNKLTNFGGETVTNGFIYKSADLVLRRSFAKKSATWEPFTEAGGGYVFLGEDGSFIFNIGAGLAYWASDNLGFSYQANYKNAIEEGGVNHFQHQLGLNIKFGGVDTDGDGVYDKYDACPEVAGLEEFQGCPDTDGDGITDKEDACPNRAGSKEMNGCPDSDGDGLSDIEDACPNRPGSVEMGGCPDTDGDGINDKDDQCPEEAGPSENNGCPWPDADGDGVADKDDACPELAGIAANNGCPELPQDVIATLNEEGTMIRFRAESAEIVGEESAAVIAKIKGILESYPSYDFVVEGHASSDGSKGYNQKLSQSRADAVQAALVAAGVDASRISTQAFGEERPIGDNNTAKGRKSNRRVQFAVGK